MEEPCENFQLSPHFQDPITRVSWDNYLTVSKSDAKNLGLKNINDRVILYEGEMIIDSSQKKVASVTVKFLFNFN